MKKIHLLTKKDGKVVLNGDARPEVSLDEICEVAENEVLAGFATYARVSVNGRTYMELEA